jgi:uncharacterized membrane protein
MTKLSGTFSIKDNKNVYAVAVAIALLLASVLLVTYYVALRPAPDQYTTIYLLDSQKKAADYPEFLVANVNSTFSVYVDVENHMGRTLNDAQVLVKVTTDLNPTFPVDVNATQTLIGTVRDGAVWENVSTVSLNQPGNYAVYFELWIPSKNGQLQFSNNFCVLNVQVSAGNETTPAPT